MQHLAIDIYLELYTICNTRNNSFCAKTECTAETKVYGYTYKRANIWNISYTFGLSRSMERPIIYPIKALRKCCFK